MAASAFPPFFFPLGNVPRVGGDIEHPSGNYSSGLWTCSRKRKAQNSKGFYKVGSIPGLMFILLIQAEFKFKSEYKFLVCCLT